MKKSQNLTDFSNNNLISIFKTFTNEELKSFYKYLKSPLFSKGRKVIDLFLIVKSYHPDYKHRDFRKDNIYKKIYGINKYNDVIMRKQISTLTKYAEDFLIFKNLHNDNIKRDISLLSEYCLRYLDKPFLKKLKELEEKLSNVMHKDEHYYYNMLLIEDIKRLYYYNNNMSYKNILKSSDFITYYYLITNLRLIYLYSISGINNVFLKKDIPIFDDIQNIILKGNYQQNPVIRAYYNIIKAFETDDDEYYFLVKKQLMTDLDVVDKVHQMSFLMIMQSIAIRKINDGKDVFRKEWRDIFKIQFERNLLFDSADETIGIIHFRNIVLLGLRVKAIDLIEKFIYNYYGRINEVYRDILLNYSLAHLFFEKKNYGTSIEFCSKINFEILRKETDIYSTIDLDIKKLLLINFYELNYYDEALSLIDTFRHTLNKPGLISDNIRIQHKNFLKYYYIIINIKNGYKELNLMNLVEEINNCSLISKKDWLILKISELIKADTLKNQ